MAYQESGNRFCNLKMPSILTVYNFETIFSHLGGAPVAVVNPQKRPAEDSQEGSQEQQQEESPIKKPKVSEAEEPAPAATETETTA